MSKVLVPCEICALLIDHWMGDEVSKDDGYKINKWLEESRLKCNQT